MRLLQLSDVCGEGRVVAGASRYEFMLTMFCSQMYRCVDDVNACLVLVHLRHGSYLLAPTTIDPSRTNNTASSRFQKLISTTKTPLLAFFHDGSIRDQTTCSLMALTHVAEEREQWSKRNATRR